MSSENIVITNLKKEKKKEYMKEYDKDRLRPLYYEEQRAEKKFCSCGCLVRRSNLLLHTKTSKHVEVLKHQTPEIKLNIEKLNEKLDSDFKVKYEQKKIEEEIKKEKERKEHEERKAKIRAKIEVKQQPIIECPCGSQFQKREQKRHDKCQQHVEYIKSQQAQQTTK
jgi:hypothetical protein